jgi:hypothetical protein
MWAFEDALEAHIVEWNVLLGTRTETVRLIAQVTTHGAFAYLGASRVESYPQE